VIDRLKKYLADNNLFLVEDKILLAVSGGIDSMVMTDLFIKCGYKVGIAHCNFSLRGEESDKDELLVKQLAKRHKQPFYSIRFDTKQYAKKQSISIQMAARELRYGWFRELCVEHSYKYIATAHNLDDKIETFFLNLTRGTGIKGLSGMPPKNDNIIHPILFVSRKEIEEYAVANKVAYREDATNATTYYARNRIRHNIIPELCAINPSFYSTMEGNMQRIMLAEQLAQQTLAVLIHKACKQEGGLFIIDIDSLKDYQPLSLFLFELLYPFGFTASTITDIENALTEQTGKRFFSTTHQLVKDRERLLISPIPQQNDKEYKIEKSTKFIETPINMVFETMPRSFIESFEAAKNIAYIDADKICYPFILRKWHVGDSFVPFGMKGKKKLSDFFIDSKLSLVEKRRQWVLLSNNEIVWVVGQRVDNRYRIDEQTKTILKIEYNKGYTE
jgi:tRNA(Ile)-lysidine synthase